jgi:hypothetical protein
MLSAAITYDTDYTVYNHKRKIKTAAFVGDTIGISSQYGGESFIDRSRCEYISCGVNRKIDAGVGIYNIDVFGGDTFICMFDTYPVASNIPEAGGLYDFNVNIFPVEMSLNYPLTMGILPSRTTDLQSTQAHTGVYTYATGIVYTQDKDMLIYNSVYSRERDTDIYLPRPANYLPINNKPNTVKFSDVKQDGETVDSWCNFKTANENISEGRYGEITDVFNLNGRLINLQPNGVGIWAVKDRSLISDSSGVQLALGVGGILERLDYQYTFEGSKHQSSLLLTANSAYFFDIKNKDWYKLTVGQGQISLTDIKHMSSFLRNNLHPELYYEDNAIGYSLKGFVVGWNKKFSEVYLSIKQKNIDNVGDTYENYTIVYNELSNTFTAFYDIPACMYINMDNKLLSVPFTYDSGSLTTGRNQIYLHDLGTRGMFYGVLYDSTIKFITTAQGNVGMYTNYSWLTELNSTLGVDLDETFDTMQSINDYQDTGVIPLVPLDIDAVGTLRRRIRTWHAEVGRDTGSVDDAQMRDKYLMSEFTYTNNADKRIVVHDFETLFYPANN